MREAQEKEQQKHAKEMKRIEKEAARVLSKKKKEAKHHAEERCKAQDAAAASSKKMQEIKAQCDKAEQATQVLAAVLLPIPCSSPHLSALMHFNLTSL